MTKREEFPKQLADIKGKLYVTNEYGVEHQDTNVKLDAEERAFLRDRFDIDPKDELHDMCVNCKARQLIRFWNQPWDEGEINQWHVRCDGVKRSMNISKASLDRIITETDLDRERALQLLTSTQDPVAWCYLMFGFDDGDEEAMSLRPYQKEQLRCNSLRMVIREGRRSGKTFIVALKLLYLAFNKKYSKGRDASGKKIYTGPEIMIITPYQSQISNIFTEIQSLVSRNKELMDAVTTGTGGSLYVKTPNHRMGFANGAVISGFVSGVGIKTGGEGGGTIRGRNAHIIYIDEMDMVPESIIDEAVLPILLTTPDTMLIATSTPIGKRAKFYNWAMTRQDFKQDHFPSSVLPHWDLIKKEVERENSEDSFRAEYMAQFIDGSHGVFKPSYVYAGRKDYVYPDCERLNWWHRVAGVNETTELIKVIGIDWNKNAGTEFVVVAYSPSRHNWYVIEATNIPSSDFSSQRWKEEVLRLNAKWKPNYIYADEGYGHTIIEDLRMLGYNMKGKKGKSTYELEASYIPERLVSFNFSSKVELRSPIDGTKFSKAGKDYLVENAIRIFEDGVVWFPETDETLRKQLLNYVVLRRSQTTNKPIYGPENRNVGDHRLDAFMLALAGTTLNFGGYSDKSLPVNKPAFFSKDALDSRSQKNEAISALELLGGKSQSRPDKFGQRKFEMSQEEFARSVIDQPQGRRSQKDSGGSLLEELVGSAYNGKEKSRSIPMDRTMRGRPSITRRRRIHRKKGRSI